MKSRADNHHCLTLLFKSFFHRYKMGAKASKRSVDISTEPSKEIQEGTGELKKLDDTFIESSVSESRQTRGDKWLINNEPL
jgi:hypothetical protein